MSRTSPRRAILHFLGMTALFSCVFYALIILTGRAGAGRGAYATGLMWCPALAALISCRINGIDLASLGWRWGAWRWQWLAYAIPLGYASAAYFIIWCAGWGGFPDPEWIDWVRKSFVWYHAPNWLVVVGATLLTATTGMAASVAHSLGEEIGWRGFLSPLMTRLYGFSRGSVLTGAIWASWHLPILLFADYNGGTALWFGATCFAVMVIGMSVIMAWLRNVSGSLWTGAIFHASHNVFIQGILTPATLRQGKMTAYAIDEFGFAVPAAVMVLAITMAANLQRLPSVRNQ